MARILQSNSTAPPFFPIQSDLGPVNLTMAAPNPNPAPPVAPSAPAPVIWAEDPDMDDFNPGTRTGQKIFEQRARGHPDGKLFSGTHAQKLSEQQRLIFQSHGMPMATQLSSRT